MSKLFINTESKISLQDNHQFMIKWWLSSHEKIHWVLIRNTSDTFLCPKCVYKIQSSDEAVKRRSRKTSKLNYIDYNEKLTLKKVHMKSSIAKQLFMACINVNLLTRDQWLFEQYHRGNTKTSENHWGTSAVQNFSRGDSNYQHTLGR